MKNLLICLSFVLFCGATAQAESRSTQSFDFRVRDYAFSRYIDVTEASQGAPDTPVATLSRSRWSMLRQRYDMLNEQGDAAATGYTRIFSWGKVFAWATHIDLFDPKNVKIGSINGQVFTTSRAQFLIFDGHGRRVGAAYVENKGTECVITDPRNFGRWIARMRREVDAATERREETLDLWHLDVYAPDAIDARLLHTFGTFITDHQASFR